jgi:hypothetical protein
MLLVMGLHLATPDMACSNGVPEVLGKTYGDWSVLFWQWAFIEPQATNPLFDKTGAFAALNQSGQVWFLGGYSGWPAENIQRQVTIPIGTYLFLPIVNIAWVNGNEDALPSITIDDETTSRTNIDNYINQFSNLIATWDGVPVVFNPDTPIVRTQSPNDFSDGSPGFTLDLKADNVLSDYGVIAGLWDQSYSDGYWVMLPPLAAGPHTLHFAASICDDPSQFQDVTYYINTPLPGSLLLLGSVLLGLAGFRRFRKN